MGGRGSGSSRGGGKAGGLDKNLINRANAASVMDMGDIINRTYHRNIEEIGNLSLSSEEKAKAMADMRSLSNDALSQAAKAVNPYASGRSRLTSAQKSGSAADKAAIARGRVDSYMSGLRETSNRNKKATEAKTLTSALTSATSSGSLEVTVNGKTYYRANRRSKTWRVR